MISFAEALSRLSTYAPKLENEVVFIKDALGYFLAKDIYAPIDLPPFSNSSVDGFAVNSDDLRDHSRLTVAGTLRAHQQVPVKLEPGACLRIMTGAPIPAGADAVVMKEHTRSEGDWIVFDGAVKAGQHIRLQGGDCEHGSLLAQQGQKIDPALLGLLLSMGIAQVSVAVLPRVSIIGTGDELTPAGMPLGFGQVYASVAPMLKAQCQHFGFSNVAIEHCPDQQITLERMIAESNAELILISGGMSQGDYDFVRPALAALKVKEIVGHGFWRPGKPLYVGRLGKKYIFGLPGNPVASFVGFRVFVEALLLEALGAKPRVKRAKIAHDFASIPNWTLFLRASLNDENEIVIAKNQDSHQIFTLSKSNALCLIDSTNTIVKAGTVVHYYPL